MSCFSVLNRFILAKYHLERERERERERVEHILDTYYVVKGSKITCRMYTNKCYCKYKIVPDTPISL